MKTWTTRILLTFAIFSLGFAVGKEAGLRKTAIAPTGLGQGNAPAAPGQDKVMVYYMHTTFRCVTCNSIEQMAKQVVETQFADARAAGRIEWREVNFQERDDLAKQYDITSSCVVVARIIAGQETGFQRLDDVWTLADQPAAFAAYVAGAVRQYLNDLTE